MSKFAQIALEDENGLDAGAEAAPEAEGTNVAVAETEAEVEEVAQENEVGDELEGEKEQLEELGDAVEAEQDGLSQEAAAILHVSLKRIIGKKLASKAVALESYGTGRSAQREAKRVALESIKETLKQFWEAIKAQLKKFYTKVKSFFTKAFSAARKLAERAKRVQERANNTTGTADEKSFSFGQTKAIAVEGKFSDPSSLLKALNGVRNWTEKNITTQKSEKYDTIIDNISGKATSLFKGGDDLADKLESFMDELEKAGDLNISPLGKGSIEPKLAESLKGGKDSKSELEVSTAIPGSKVLVHISAIKEGDGSEVLFHALKNTRFVISNDKFNAREVSEGDVKTLTTSQIDTICDDVIEIAETAYSYEKAWERRDKFQAKLEREIDSAVKDVTGDIRDSDEGTAKQERLVRNFASAITGSVRRRTSFESQFISYALSTSAAFLNYAERSLAQYK